MKNYYKISKKKFKEYVKENPKCKMSEWDNYAHECCFFSAFTLSCHVNAYSFDELKKKMK